MKKLLFCLLIVVSLGCSNRSAINSIRETWPSCQFENIGNHVFLVKDGTNIYTVYYSGATGILNFRDYPHKVIAHFGSEVIGKERDK